MTEKLIPREKLGRKARNAADALTRRVWECSPVPGIVESGRKYNRKKAARARYDTE